MGKITLSEWAVRLEEQATHQWQKAGNDAVVVLTLQEVESLLLAIEARLMEITE